MWRGKDVSLEGLHMWVRSRKPKPILCENCQKVPPYDLANVSQEYKRDLSDWKWICRKCHMLEDGRLEKLKRTQFGKKTDRNRVRVEVI
jgi:hypothetical protein